MDAKDQNLKTLRDAILWPFIVTVAIALVVSFFTGPWLLSAFLATLLAVLPLVVREYRAPILAGLSWIHQRTGLQAGPQLTPFVPLENALLDPILWKGQKSFSQDLKANRIFNPQWAVKNLTTLIESNAVLPVFLMLGKPNSGKTGLLFIVGSDLREQHGKDVFYWTFKADPDIDTEVIRDVLRQYVGHNGVFLIDDCHLARAETLFSLLISLEEMGPDGNQVIFASRVGTFVNSALFFQNFADDGDLSRCRYDHYVSRPTLSELLIHFAKRFSYSLDIARKIQTDSATVDKLYSLCHRDIGLAVELLDAWQPEHGSFAESLEKIDITELYRRKFHTLLTIDGEDTAEYISFVKNVIMPVWICGELEIPCDAAMIEEKAGSARKYLNALLSQGDIIRSKNAYYVPSVRGAGRLLSAAAVDLGIQVEPLIEDILSDYISRHPEKVAQVFWRLLSNNKADVMVRLFRKWFQHPDQFQASIASIRERRLSDVLSLLFAAKEAGLSQLEIDEALDKTVRVAAGRALSNSFIKSVLDARGATPHLIGLAAYISPRTARELFASVESDTYTKSHTLAHLTYVLRTCRMFSVPPDLVWEFIKPLQDVPFIERVLSSTPKTFERFLRYLHWSREDVHLADRLLQSLKQDGLEKIVDHLLGRGLSAAVLSSILTGLKTSQRRISELFHAIRFKKLLENSSPVDLARLLRFHLYLFLPVYHVFEGEHFPKLLQTSSIRELCTLLSGIADNIGGRDYAVALIRRISCPEFLDKLRIASVKEILLLFQTLVTRRLTIPQELAAFMEDELPSTLLTRYEEYHLADLSHFALLLRSFDHVPKETEARTILLGTLDNLARNKIGKVRPAPLKEINIFLQALESAFSREVAQYWASMLWEDLSSREELQKKVRSRSQVSTILRFARLMARHGLQTQTFVIPQIAAHITTMLKKEARQSSYSYLRHVQHFLIQGYLLFREKLFAEFEKCRSAILSDAEFYEALRKGSMDDVFGALWALWATDESGAALDGRLVSELQCRVNISNYYTYPNIVLAAIGLCYYAQIELEGAHKLRQHLFRYDDHFMWWLYSENHILAIALGITGLSIAYGHKQLLERWGQIAKQLLRERLADIVADYTIWNKKTEPVIKDLMNIVGINGKNVIFP